MRVRGVAALAAAGLVVLLQAASGCGGGASGATPDGGWGDARRDGPKGPLPGADAGGCGLRTCLSVGANCGPIGDGCGGTLDCGSCTAPDACGGGGTPNVCGSIG